MTLEETDMCLLTQMSNSKHQQPIYFNYICEIIQNTVPVSLLGEISECVLIALPWKDEYGQTQSFLSTISIAYSLLIKSLAMSTFRFRQL